MTFGVIGMIVIASAAVLCCAASYCGPIVRRIAMLVFIVIALFWATAWLILWLLGEGKQTAQ